MVANEAEGRAEALRRIAACRAAQAEELDLRGLQLTALDGELLDALCQLGWLRGLLLGGAGDALEASNNKVRELPGVLCDALPRLERLDLAYSRLFELPASIANLAVLTRLTSLDLCINLIGAEGAQALRGLVNLTSLDLYGNDIEAEGAQALRGLVKLTSLNLQSNYIGDEGAQALKDLVNLTSLNLYRNYIGAEGAQALRGLVNLTSLELGDNDIGDEGAQALRDLVNLTYLGLDANNIHDISPLVSLSELESINLSGNRLDHLVPEFWMLPSLKFVHLLDGATMPGVPVETLGEDCLDRLRAYLIGRRHRSR
jgi:Leucine-rich repeat (LRR) protein